MNAYEKLRKKISEDLIPHSREIGKSLSDICGNFKMLGFETAVWLPEKIHTANLGGIEANTFFGYSRIEGRWGLVIRTIECSQKSGEYVSQRIITLESCSNLEILANSLERVEELTTCIREAMERQAIAVEKLEAMMKKLQQL